MENIIIGIAISIILPIAYGFFYHFKEKEEKKIVYGSEFTVKTSKIVILFFLTWMIICFLGMVGGVIFLLVTEEPDKNQLFWVLEVISFLFLLLAVIGFSIGKYNYLVIKEEGIYVKKMFKKEKLIKYSDITYISSELYSNSCSSGVSQVACYDLNGIPLFAVDSNYIGIERLDSKLRNKGYLLLPNPYPSEDMKNNIKFQRYKKKSSAKVGFWCFLLLGILSLLLGIFINSLSCFTDYKNYEVSGVVEKYYIGEETVKISLKDDEKSYYINNIVYEELNEDVYNVLKENIEIKLHIAYQDKYDRYNVSQLEIDGQIYLHMEAAESAEYSNYRIGLRSSYIFMGIAFVLEIFALIYFVKLKKLKED